MSEQHPLNEVGEVAEDAGQIEGQVQAVALPSRFRWLRRLGCFILLVIWFTILLLPCFFIVLAAQQQIVISQGSLPGQQIRIWLVMEVSQRGIGISTTSVHAMPEDSAPPNGGLCLQTDVNYLLWQGQGEPTTYCECYFRDGESWLPAVMYSEACPP